MGHRDHYIGGKWLTGSGVSLASRSPIGDDVVWQGTAATDGEVDLAVEAARRALGGWSDVSFAARCEIARHFAALVKRHEEVFSRLISREMGKPLWESRTEAAAVIGKVDLSIRAWNERRAEQEEVIGDGRAVVRYRPHGVLAVLGPFNLPAHLPNGHIVPALLAGNTIVFKPSEATPAVGEMMVDLWHEAGLPAGVLNLVQGAAGTARYLSRHDGLDGLLFTGSYRVGLELSKFFGEHPERILALEMGGNNPLIVDRCADHDAAAYLTVQSAYVTSGQRCSCARRLIVPRGADGDRFVERLVAWIGRVRIGPFDQEPEPFYGPVVSRAAAGRLLDAQSEMVAAGGNPLVEMRRSGGHEALLTPGLIDMTSATVRRDDEWFGPLLQLIRVDDWEQALFEANRTSFGLAAGLLSDDPERYREFRRRIRAGVINWNRQTTGASGKLPFGGLGSSGNHRPSGFHAVDYCADPIASLEYDRVALPTPLPIGFTTS